MATKQRAQIRVTSQDDADRVIGELLDHLRYNIKLYGGFSDERTLMMRRQYNEIVRISALVKACESPVIEMSLEDAQLLQIILMPPAVPATEGNQL